MANQVVGQLTIQDGGEPITSVTVDENLFNDNFTIGLDGTVTAIADIDFDGGDPNSLDPFGDSSLTNFWKFDGDLINSIAGGYTITTGGVLANNELTLENGQNIRLQTSISHINFKVTIPDNEVQNGRLLSNSNFDLIISKQVYGGGAFDPNLGTGKTALWYNGTDNIYVNGVLKDDLSGEWLSGGTSIYYVLDYNVEYTISVELSTSDIYLGRFYNQTNYHVNIELDHLQIFNRALTAQEVQDLYNATNPWASPQTFTLNATNSIGTTSEPFTVTVTNDTADD